MNYFIWTEGREEGPIEIAELHRRLDQGLLPPGVLCRTEESSDWVALAEVLEADSPQPKSTQQRHRAFGLRHWIILAVCIAAGGLAWLITKTKLWDVVGASTLGAVGAAIVLLLVVLVIIWAVLWTIFPVFVYLYLRDIRDDISEIRRLAAAKRSDR